MPKRTLAALLALLVAASTLAVVAQPAAAHSQTTTKQRCSYDPFAGRRCWTETVTVAHTHSCGAGMTGTYPNCYPIPPANQNCGAGTTGTFPDCYPIPPDDKNSDDSGGDDDDGGGTDTDSDDSSGDTDDTDSDDSSGDDDDEGGSFEPTVVTCTGGSHRFGDGCHTHGFTPPAGQCGTGKTWAPHAGYRPVALPACKTTATADPCGDYAENLIAALNKVSDGTNTPPTLPATPTQCIGASTSDLLTAIGNALAALGKGHPNNSEEIRKARREAYEQLAKAMQAAWDYEIPGVEHVEAASTAAACYVFVAAVVRTRGKALRVPGFGQAAATFGCERIIAAVEIDIDGTDSTDSNDADDTDPAENGPPTLDDVKKAEDKFKRGELKKDVLTRIQNEYDCAQGWADACAALGR